MFVLLQVMGKKHALIIKPNPTDPAARHMQLACESEDEAREWTEALFKASMGAWLQEQSEKDARDAAERQGAAATRLAQLQHLLRDAEDALKAESEKHAAAVARIASLESQVTVLSDATCDVVRRLEDGPISSLAAITDDLLVALKVSHLGATLLPACDHTTFFLTQIGPSQTWGCGYFF